MASYCIYCAANVYTMYIDGIAVPYTSTGTAAAAMTNATFPLILR
jgi:hypothetical protein